MIKKYNIEPTDENILESFINDTYGRNEELKNYIELLDKAENFPVLALNADWGEGKTFFVLQAKMILENLNPNCSQDEHIKEQIDQCFATPQRMREKPNLSRKLIPIYYNAWLYDDHENPIESFLYFLTVTFDREYGRLSSKGIEKINAILKLMSIWKFGVGIDLGKLVTAFEGENTSKRVARLEDVKLLVDEAFSELLGENDGLIVFVDEIDRCNPRYAVDFLEMIKHFFTCAKVQFAFSTNLHQLSETIRNVYGNGFDGGRYLNKFFDTVIDLPSVSPEKYLDAVAYRRSSNYATDFARSLIVSMHFSPRDANDYLGRVEAVIEKINVAIRNSWSYKSTGMAYVCYPLVLVALSIANRKSYHDFLNGEGENLLIELISEWDEWKSFTKDTLLRGEDTKQNGIDDFKTAIRTDYRRIFGKGEKDEYDEYTRQIKDDVIRIASLIG